MELIKDLKVRCTGDRIDERLKNWKIKWLKEWKIARWGAQIIVVIVCCLLKLEDVSAILGQDYICPMTSSHTIILL